MPIAVEMSVAFMGFIHSGVSIPNIISTQYASIMSIGNGK